MAELTIIDGSMSFAGGVNSLKPTTVQSPRYPDGLHRNQLAWLNNATVRGGGVTCRNGWQYLCTVSTEGLLYQGGSVYEPNEADPYLILSIGGKLLRVRVDTDNSVDQINSGVTLNPSDEDQAFFVQGEQFLVIQAGDNVTLPLFWDGSILRRSNGLVSTATYRGRITDSGWATPATGSTVTVTLSTPYLGQTGDIIILPGELSLAPDLVTIISWATAKSRWQVTAIAGANVTLKLIETQTPGAFNAANLPAITVTTPEIPAGTAMDYYMGRIWYARGRTYAAGDIVKGPSGTATYNFRDSILKVTENPLAVGGDGFTVPGEAGNIRAIFHTAEKNTALGQGQLYVSTRRGIFRLNVPVSRQTWIDSNDSTQPLQTVVQIGYGSVSDRCNVRANGDVFYSTMEPAIRSLALTVRNDKQWGDTPISRNVTRVLKFNDRELMRFVSGINFDNRMFQAALPIQTPVGVAFQSIVPLDFDLISTLEEQLPPAWEGIYEGLDILQLFEADFGGRQRAFAVVRSKEQATADDIQVWEITDHLKSDINRSGESRVTWVMETPAYTWGQEFLLKRLVGGELWIDRIHGTVMFRVEYRPDGDACWHLWNTFDVCSAKNSCEDVNNPVCYPITPYAEGYRQVISLPRPQEGECNRTMGRPTNVGYQMQVKVTVTGWCRIRGLMLQGEGVEKPMYDNMVCPGTLPEPPAVPADIGTITSTTDPGYDPFIGPPYPTVGFQAFSFAAQPRVRFTVPDVLIETAILYRRDPLLTSEVSVRNYEWPTYNAGTTYITNQKASFGGVRYLSLSEGNLNHTPGAVGSEGWWTVDPTGFELWWWNGGTYQKIGDSNTVTSSTVVWSWETLKFTAHLQGQGTNPWSFIIKSTTSNFTLQSNPFGFYETCTAATPINLHFVQGGPQGGTFIWTEGGVDFPGLDYVLAIGQTNGGPYDEVLASVNRENQFYAIDGLSGATRYAIVCKRDSTLCVSPASNQVTFSLP